MNINLERYYKALEPTKCPKTKIGIYLFLLKSRFNCWLICGFCYIRNEYGNWIWNDSYHLLSKLCRYESWNDVKITWWDKIRFRIVTGYKFE